MRVYVCNKKINKTEPRLFFFGLTNRNLKTLSSSPNQKNLTEFDSNNEEDTFLETQETAQRLN